MTTEQQSTAPNVTTKLRHEVFVEVCNERGLKTNAAVAKALGTSEKTVSRVTTGDTASGEFIAKALAFWPRLSFRSLFAVVDATTGEERR